MTTYIALLRAVNLPSYKKVGMADLRALLTKLGFANPRSALQSGNLVFDANGKTPEQLERVLEMEAEKKLDLETDFFVRSAEEWTEVMARNPFRDEAARDPGHLVVMTLKEAPSTSDVRTLQTAIKGRELVRAVGRHAYFVYPDGIGRSRLTMPLIEAKLGTRGTGRNWNTVLKLASLARE